MTRSWCQRLPCHQPGAEGWHQGGLPYVPSGPRDSRSNGINVEEFRPREKTFAEVPAEQTRTILWLASPSEETCAKYKRWLSSSKGGRVEASGRPPFQSNGNLEKRLRTRVSSARGQGQSQNSQGEKAGRGAWVQSTPLLGAGGQDQLAEMYTVANLGCFPSFASDAELLVCKHCCLPLDSMAFQNDAEGGVMHGECVAQPALLELKREEEKRSEETVALKKARREEPTSAGRRTAPPAAWDPQPSWASAPRKTRAALSTTRRRTPSESSPR